MAKASEREIRALPVPLEVRQVDDTGKRTIAGTIKYNTQSVEMRDWWGD